MRKVSYERDDEGGYQGVYAGALQISHGMLVGFRMTREELRSGVHAWYPPSSSRL